MDKTIVQCLILAQVNEPAIFLNLTKLSLRNFDANSLLFVLSVCTNLASLDANDIVISNLAIPRCTPICANLHHLRMSFLDARPAPLEHLLNAMYLPCLHGLDIRCSASGIGTFSPSSFFDFLTRNCMSTSGTAANSLRGLSISRYEVHDEHLFQLAEVLKSLEALWVDNYISRERKFLRRLSAFDSPETDAALSLPRLSHLRLKVAGSLSDDDINLLLEVIGVRQCVNIFHEDVFGGQEAESSAGPQIQTFGLEQEDNNNSQLSDAMHNGLLDNSAFHRGLRIIVNGRLYVDGKWTVTV